MREKKRTLWPTTTKSVKASTAPGELKRPRRRKIQTSGPERARSRRHAAAASAKGARKIASAASDFEWNERITV
ncbi:MAG: hypothetical protein IPN17_11960 [Deltaproteobacteria bacterium]|nr:hypothetical protein [Deltaproteobacteria bacterium]